MSIEMDSGIYAKITEHSERGNELEEAGDYEGALREFSSALSLVPAPLTNWEAATWLLTAIGETHLFAGEYLEAREALTTAMHCPNSIGNPLIHLRLGEVQFELGDVEKARDELARAYLGGGDDLFEGENPKYLDLVKKSLRPPA
jgi:tetratricopeptide (TPR) repeat protein